MNRRADDRIEMKLPCHLRFPAIWPAAVAGVTANFHRNGILVACNLSSALGEPPAVGERASIRVVLPANHHFTQKCIDCEATLLRTRQISSGQWQFALRIQSVDFGDWTPERQHLVDLDSESCRYIV
ncbi:MAG: hypothetical protein JWO80_4097 [Bryobacterales bacterium]|nr:hypothetical protein [Bryobacterales bacterium]